MKSKTTKPQDATKGILGFSFYLNLINISMNNYTIVHFLIAPPKETTS